MQFNEITFRDAVPVDGYGAGFFRVGGEVFEGALLMFGAGPNAWGGLEDTDSLLALKDHVDVLLLGMGGELRPLPVAQRNVLEEAGLGVEIMTSPSACRTYNVLLSEGRRVALAAIPV